MKTMEVEVMVEKYEIWLADLNPKVGTALGKVRPVLVVQTNFLNTVPHPSTLICPITPQVKRDAAPLRMDILKNESSLTSDSQIMIDQIRAIDNRRFVKKVGNLPPHRISVAEEYLALVLDLN